MTLRPDRRRILANRSKRPGSFWTLSEFIARFLIGRDTAPTEAQYERFVDAMFEGDPLADKVAEWMLEHGVARSLRVLDRAIREGIDAVESPPDVLRAFFAAVDRKPAWVDDAMLLAGQRAMQRTGVLMPYILGDITLVGGYLTMSAMNKSLVATGALGPGGSERRLMETLSWWLDVTGDHGLDRNGPGFSSTVKVRVMHALVRARLSKSPDWRFEEWGAPISQAHVATTNQAFAVAYITLARAFGIRYSRDERRAMMHLFRYAGFLIGVREDLCCSSEVEGFRLIRMSTETSPPPDEDAARLAEGYFAAELAFGHLLPPSPGVQALARVATWLSTRSRIGTLRFLLGPSDSKALRLPPAGIAVLFPVLLAGATVTAQAATSVIPGARALESRLGRRIHLGVKRLSPQSGESTYMPYEHRARTGGPSARASIDHSPQR